MIKPKNYGYVFVLPFFLVVLVFQALPILDTVVTSFTNDSMSALDQVPVFIGWENYARELQSVLLSQALVNTLVMTAVSLVFQFLFALMLTAFLTSPDLKIRGQNTWLVLFFLPSQISVAVLTLNLLMFFYPDQGVVTMLFQGGDPGFARVLMESDWSAWLFIIGGTVFLSFGITTYFLVNSVRTLPRALFEAARIDGASGRQIFFRISLPSLAPILIFLVVVSLVLDLTMFDLPFALYPSSGSTGSFTSLGFNGGVGQSGVTLGTYAYSRSFVWDFDLGAGASVVMVMFVLISSLALAYLRMVRKTNEEFTVVR